MQSRTSANFFNTQCSKYLLKNWNQYTESVEWDTRKHKVN